MRSRIQVWTRVWWALMIACVSTVGLQACQPTQPTPAPDVIVTNNIIIGGTPASPSPGGNAPAGKPDVVKVTQFGETCPAGSGLTTSGGDRTVSVGCSKAITCSPKCKGSDGFLRDCPIPSGAVPDEFRVTSGEDRIIFSASSSNPAFNRDARGVSTGLVLIDCTFAGVRSEPFDLTVVP